MSEHCGGCEGENHDRCVDEGFDCTAGVGQCLPCVGLALPAVDAVALMREAARIIDLYAGTYQATAHGCAARLREAADEAEGRKG